MNHERGSHDARATLHRTRHCQRSRYKRLPPTNGARAAASWNEYERQDDKFHQAVAEASDNPLLIAIYDDVVRVKRKVAWGSVTRDNARPPLHHSSFAEHDAIYKAIAVHDQEAAFREMKKHLESVSARLFGDS